MFTWSEIKRLNSESAFEQFRAAEMCCSQIANTVRSDTCDVCGGDHERKERRIRCTSKTCSENGACGVVWKARQCPVRDLWVVRVNDATHSRGELPCFAKHRSVVTKAMKRFTSEQEENNATPRLIAIRLKKRVDIAPSVHGWPTVLQISNALKRVREAQGARNDIETIARFISARIYHPQHEMDPTKVFVFGPGIDMDGVSHVGSGHDDDPFILGVTSPHLLDSIIRHTRVSQFILMHADATFKLSDVAYPVITIGFSDASRSYRLAALFVVSQRTRRDYRICFQELVNVIRKHRGVTFRVDAIMGDAEDAQLLGFQDVPEFANVTPLMFCFHALYNVQKRISHLPVELRKVVMRSIIDMHFTESMEDFVRCRTAELKRWQQLPGLRSFTDYFIQQWLSGRFWRW